jgi:hypothetical protein
MLFNVTENRLQEINKNFKKLSLKGTNHALELKPKSPSRFHLTSLSDCSLSPIAATFFSRRCSSLSLEAHHTLARTHRCVFSKSAKKNARISDPSEHREKHEKYLRQ